MSGRGGREGERAATLTSFWKFVFIKSTDWFFFICIHTLKSLNMFHRDNFNRFSFSSIHFSLSLLIFRFYNYINFIFNAPNQFIIYLKEERRKKLMATTQQPCAERMRQHIQWDVIFTGLVFIYRSYADAVFFRFSSSSFFSARSHPPHPTALGVCVCSCEYVFVRCKFNDFYHTLTLSLWFNFGFIFFTIFYFIFNTNISF